MTPRSSATDTTLPDAAGAIEVAESEDTVDVQAVGVQPSEDAADQDAATPQDTPIELDSAPEGQDAAGPDTV